MLCCCKDTVDEHFLHASAASLQERTADPKLGLDSFTVKPLSPSTIWTRSEIISQFCGPVSCRAKGSVS